MGGGGVKVISSHNKDEGGSVELIIIGSNFDAPSINVIKKIQEEMDPVEYGGLGKGIAPVGHTVTVVGVKARQIDMSLTIDSENKSENERKEIEEKAEGVINDFFIELAKKWDSIEPEKGIIIHESQVISRIMNISGVANVIINSLTKGEIVSQDTDDETLPFDIGEDDSEYRTIENGLILKYDEIPTVGKISFGGDEGNE